MPLKLGLLIQTNRMIYVEFRDFSFEIEREVARFETCSIDKIFSPPMRVKEHPNYSYSYLSGRIYEKLYYIYPRNNVERFVLKKILENL